MTNEEFQRRIMLAHLAMNVFDKAKAFSGTATSEDLIEAAKTLLGKVIDAEEMIKVDPKERSTY